MKETKGTIARLKNSPAAAGRRQISASGAITLGDLEDPLDGDVHADQQGRRADARQRNEERQHRREHLAAGLEVLICARPGHRAQRRRQPQLSTDRKPMVVMHSKNGP